MLEELTNILVMMVVGKVRASVYCLYSLLATYVFFFLNCLIANDFVKRISPNKFNLIN